MVPKFEVGTFSLGMKITSPKAKDILYLVYTPFEQC